MEQIFNAATQPEIRTATLRRLSLEELLLAFAAGKEVPGSGSANALTAALAACLAASVAIKTYGSEAMRYRIVQQTAADAERRARKIITELSELLEQDSEAFAPVIALRRETGRALDPYLQDQARRREIAALKPATEIPLRIAELALDAGQLAMIMLDSGFAPARGESYTALSQAISAVDGAIYVAQLNVRTVRQRVVTLNDPLFETEWITSVFQKIRRLRDVLVDLRVRQDLARKAMNDEMSTPSARFRQQREDKGDLDRSADR